MNGINLLLTTTFVLATAVANVLLKKAMSAPGLSFGFSPELIRGLLASSWLWGGMVSYAVALTMYLALLARVPLNVATSIASLNFVAVLLASRLVLSEPIPPLRYLGFACILVGMYVVSLTQYRSP
jgi:drug/metabolite transporter (DMT)-like permease